MPKEVMKRRKNNVLNVVLVDYHLADILWCEWTSAGGRLAAMLSSLCPRPLWSHMYPTTSSGAAHFACVARYLNPSHYYYSLSLVSP